MRAIKTCLIVTVILLMGVAARAEDKTTYMTNLAATTMPTIDMANKPLEKVFYELKAKVPDFHFVIFRAPGVPLNYPVLPGMSLENVHIDQFLTLISDEFPCVSIKYNIDNYGNSTPLVEVNIKPDPMATTLPTVAPPIVRVFGLHDLISARMVLFAGKHLTQKQVTDDILSLVMAAQDQIENAKLPVVKFHQPTDTLIFKGTNEQASLLEQSLSTLAVDPNRVYEVYVGRMDQLTAENNRLQDELAKRSSPTTQPRK